MAKVRLAAEGDLGELVALIAEEFAVPAGNLGVAFYFDYRGPTMNIGLYRDGIETAIRSLLRRAVHVRPGGAIFFSTEVTQKGSRSVSLVLQVMDTGLAATEPTAGALIRAISAVGVGNCVSHKDQEDLEAVKAVCERMGGTVSTGSAPAEGSVVRVEFMLDLKCQAADHTVALEHGASAWLLGTPPIMLESLVRRLHRLGWRVHLLPGVAQARDALKAGARRPQVVIGAECCHVSLADLTSFAAEMAPSCAVCMRLTSPASAQPDELGFVENVQLFVVPLSPAELYQMTVTAVAKMGKVLRLSSSSEQALSRRPRALLVEDNEVNQYLSTELLCLFGFEVDVVQNGQEAVDYLGHQLPALVVMDINMPVMDGFEATRRIRELERRGVIPHVAIVAATAQDDVYTRDTAKQAGVDGFIPKPFDLGLMQQEIARVLRITSFELPGGTWQCA